MVIPDIANIHGATPSENESLLNFQLNSQLAMYSSSPLPSQDSGLEVGDSTQHIEATAGHGNEFSSEQFDWESVMADYNEAQQAVEQRYRQMNTLQHISEATPWLKNTGFQAHLQKLDTSEFGASYTIPKEEGHELKTLADSVDRILRKAMRLIRTTDDDQPDAPKVNRLNRRVLNTFNRKETSQDPINHFQEENSVKKLDTVLGGIALLLGSSGD